MDERVKVFMSCNINGVVGDGNEGIMVRGTSSQAVILGCVHKIFKNENLSMSIFIPELATLIKWALSTDRCRPRHCQFCQLSHSHA